MDEELDALLKTIDPVKAQIIRGIIGAMDQRIRQLNGALAAWRKESKMIRVSTKPGARLLQLEGIPDAEITSMSDDECRKRFAEIKARDKAVAEDPNTEIPEPAGVPDAEGATHARAGYTLEQLKSLSRGQRLKLHKKLMRKEIKEGWKPTPEQKRATAESVRKFMLAVDRVPFTTARELVDALSTLTPDSDTSTRIRVACTLQAMQAGSQKGTLMAEAEAALGKTISAVIREFD